MIIYGRCTCTSVAASVMYEYGLRLGREVPGAQSLKKQVITSSVYICAEQLHAYIVI